MEQNENNLLYDDEGEPTRTSEEQKKLEEAVSEIYDGDTSKSLRLLRISHEIFLAKGLEGVGSGYQSLDASRPWMFYWILNATDLINMKIEETNKLRVVNFLNRCQNKSGGFGGGPGQLSHLAPTYAATNALMITGIEEAYKCIDRKKLYEFLLSVKQPDGSFVMHKDGEVDVRGCYCALSAAYLLNIITPELTAGTAEYIARCQTYEGGMGAEPGNEAHGGYTFCALAALALIGPEATKLIDLPRLINWAVHRQMKFEGGFQGRTAKLVDSCYSFWQGGIFPVIDLISSQRNNEQTEYETDLMPKQSHHDYKEKKEEGSADDQKGSDHDGSWLFVQKDLQKYILLCCQEKPGGGFKDKPGKYKDYYHTCYALSGLSVAQHNRAGTPPTIFGDKTNLLELTHPVFNIHPTKVKKALEYFRKLPSVKDL